MEQVNLLLDKWWCRNRQVATSDSIHILNADYWFTTVIFCFRTVCYVLIYTSAACRSTMRAACKLSSITEACRSIWVIHEEQEGGNNKSRHQPLDLDDQLESGTISCYEIVLIITVSVWVCFLSIRFESMQDSWHNPDSLSPLSQTGLCRWVLSWHLWNLRKMMRGLDTKGNRQGE